MQTWKTCQHANGGVCPVLIATDRHCHATKAQLCQIFAPRHHRCHKLSITCENTAFICIHTVIQDSSNPVFNDIGAEFFPWPIYRCHIISNPILSYLAHIHIIRHIMIYNDLYIYDVNWCDMIWYDILWLWLWYDMIMIMIWCDMICISVHTICISLSISISLIWDQAFCSSLSTWKWHQASLPYCSWSADGSNERFSSARSLGRWWHSGFKHHASPVITLSNFERLTMYDLYWNI